MLGMIMICGIGIDTVENGRLEKIIENGVLNF